jgi:hypothetical protein
MVKNGSAANDQKRRNFIQRGIEFAVAAGLTSITMFGCSEKKEEKEVSPPEDLMNL